MVVRHGERHELVKGHPVLGVDVEQPWAHRSELEPLPDDADWHEEGGRDFLLGFAAFAQRLKGTKLVKRMQGRALDVFREAVFLGDALLAHHAGHRRGLGETLLLDEQLERAEAAVWPNPAAARAGLGA